jgi:hypothetical protein
VQVSTILDQIDNGDIALPEFQRGYVWNREQVRGLLTSLYRGYPIGGFMMWTTPAVSAQSRGVGARLDGNVRLLLDGQQRITSLYGVVRGRPPQFFEGNVAAFTGLYFNLEDETFEFYAQLKMKDNPLWVDVSKVMADIGPFIAALAPSGSDKLPTYLSRLAQVANIKQRDVHIDEVTGQDKTLDVVVDIFNRVNSGGTKLSKGDLALAKICASWPSAREEMNGVLATWRGAGFDFSLDWLLRNTNAIATGEALFSALSDVPSNHIQDSLRRATAHVGYLLNLVSGRLGLDHDRVLMGRYAFPVMARFVDQAPTAKLTATDANALLHWYIHASMWGRFAGSTETVLNQDLNAVDEAGLPGLRDNLLRMRADLTVRPGDFDGYSLGARFYPVLYMLTRTLSARDLGDGIPLSQSLLGHNTRLEVHHIFPKARLYAADYERAEVNAVANFCFLTKGSNLQISDRDPAVYFREVEEAQPGALASQWIPMDEDLWQVSRYLDFLAARRELLADAVNSFLHTLTNTTGSGFEVGEHEIVAVAPSVEPEADPEADDLRELVQWVHAQGYAKGAIDQEVIHPVTGEVVAMAEAFWPQGLQEGLDSAVMLELDPEPDTLNTLSALGILVFTTTDALRKHVASLDFESTEDLVGA